MGVINKRIRIGGMTCVSCQNRIARKLKNTAGVKNAAVSYSAGFADITYDADVVALKDIKAIIEKLGYEVLPEGEKPEVNGKRLVGLLVLVISLYVLLRQFGILNLLAPSRLADTKMGYGMLFVIGLVTSVHCIAMCGGINLSQCIPGTENGNENNSRLAVLRPALLYNLGRVLSYTAIGFLLGLLGGLLGGGSEAGLPTLFQGIIKMIAGALMVVMGLNMLGIFPWLRRFRVRMPKSLAVRLGRKKAESRRPLIVGLLNGLMPCGPLQSMQIVALASGSSLTGALAMLMFSLGTVPLMLGLGSLVAVLGKKFSRRVMSVGAVLVVVLGLAMLSQGGSLSGLLLPDQLLALVVMLSVVGAVVSIPFERSLYRAVGIAAVIVVMLGGGIVWERLSELVGLREAVMAAEEAEVTDGVQVINSTLAAGRYPNITVQAGIPVRWVIDAPEGSVNGCNYRMLLQEYGIVYELTEGENVIEFTPTKAGTIQYTCWMGMIRGNIFVTDTAAEDMDASGGVSVPQPAGYSIPTDSIAVAALSVDGSGRQSQEISVTLTDEGFSPAVIVVQQDLAVIWTIDVETEDGENGAALLAPYYSTALPLSAGVNQLSLYPTESFDVSTGDNRFYCYIKVVDDLSAVEESAIKEEVAAFETLIYPEEIFESAGMSCCG